MNELLKSVKADLLDRRLMPIVALVVVALVGAVGYAVVGGGSSTPTGGAALAGVPSHGTPGIVVTPALASAGQAVAETTNGSAAQRNGSAHDPFTLLPAAKAAATALSSPKGGAGTGGSGTGSAAGGTKSSTTPSAGSSTPATPAPATPKPATPAKPKTLYTVSVQFGTLPLAPGAELKSYNGLAKATPLPSAKEKIVEILGVTVTAKATSAAFAVGGEVILHGAGVCVPSPAQCKLITLEEGKSEQLEYLLPSGQPITYELKVVRIASNRASGASVARVLKAQAKAAGRLLARGGVLRLAGLHYSATAGLLVFDHHSAFGAHAGASRRRARHSG
jgi:hypothetical protein